jgi:hypothetical protein
MNSILKSFFKNLSVFTILALATVSLAGTTSYAQLPDVNPCSGTTSNQLGCGNDGIFSFFTKVPAGGVVGVGSIIKNVATLLIYFMSVIAIIVIIFGSFQYLTGNGKAGKETIINAVIGLIVALVSFGIVRVVSSILKLA